MCSNENRLLKALKSKKEKIKERRNEDIDGAIEEIIAVLEDTPVSGLEVVIESEKTQSLLPGQYKEVKDIVEKVVKGADLEVQIGGSKKNGKESCQFRFKFPE